MANDSATDLNSPKTGVITKVVLVTAGQVRNVVFELGQIVQLLGRTVFRAVRPQPAGYWKVARDELYTMLRRAIVPALASLGLYVFLVGTFVIAFLKLLGAPNRDGAFFIVTNAREFTPFMTGFAIAGIVGTSITADLGARKIREELDALAVLGLDPIREFVIPKVLATVVLTALVNLWALLAGTLISIFTTLVLANASLAGYMESLRTTVTPVEIWGTELKTALIGLAISIVCCHKGLNAQGGPEGLGRAVNHAVVISFIGVMVVNFCFNAIEQGFFPELNILR